jgi:hypothetical protein
MELRARTPAPLRRAALLAALPALLVPAVAGTTTAQAKTHAPIVKRISPKHVFVGETLTIRGRYFRRGINKNTVAFKRKGAKAVFVKAEKGTTKLLKVTLPKRLERVLVVKNGTPTATRLRIRVLAKKFGKRFTSRSKSPLVSPERPPVPPKPPAVDPDGDCDGDHVVNRLDADDDNDLLGDAYETSISKLLDTCKADTDGDGIEDGYEFQSARDLNDDEDQNPNAYLPYPTKRPYPNPLDKTDAAIDHDGDDLTLSEEYRLWTLAGPRALNRLSYSAGEQFSRSVRAGGTGSRTPNLPAAGYDKQTAFLSWASTHGYSTITLSPVTATNWWDGRQPFDIRDFDRTGGGAGGVSGLERTYYDFQGSGVGWLSDAERDEDADGLTNWAETRGCMRQGYWTGLYDGETKYYLNYSGTDLDDPDTDGDGIRDGADDDDHDDVPNMMECSRSLALGGIAEDPDNPTPFPSHPQQGFVNPFNPCLPHPYSRGCKRIVPFSGAWAPFNEDEKYYLVKN